MIRKRVRETVRKTSEQQVYEAASAHRRRHWGKQRALRVSPSGFVRKESGWGIPFPRPFPPKFACFIARRGVFWTHVWSFGTWAIDDSGSIYLGGPAHAQRAAAYLQGLQPFASVGSSGNRRMRSAEMVRPASMSESPMSSIAFFKLRLSWTSFFFRCSSGTSFNRPHR